MLKLFKRLMSDTEEHFVVTHLVNQNCVYDVETKSNDKVLNLKPVVITCDQMILERKVTDTRMIVYVKDNKIHIEKLI